MSNEWLWPPWPNRAAEQRRCRERKRSKFKNKNDSKNESRPDEEKSRPKRSSNSLNSNCRRSSGKLSNCHTTFTIGHTLKVLRKRRKKTSHLIGPNRSIAVTKTTFKWHNSWHKQVNYKVVQFLTGQLFSRAKIRRHSIVVDGAQNCTPPLWPEQERTAYKHRKQCEQQHHYRSMRLLVFLMFALTALMCTATAGSQLALQSDPRPTIYSGQVSFGLLLSAHSSPGPDLLAAATATASSQTWSQSSLLNSTTPKMDEEIMETSGSAESQVWSEWRQRRQIFERARGSRKREREQQEPAQNTNKQVMATCSQVQPNALYAGMGAIWASHQANLVGDSPLAIGTYVYDSCNDLDVGQRQSVRIVANLNAFQQTTCEAPRGSPISLTIAHGDNQVRAIQLLSSFRVPVITTREHFALEDYTQLTRDQRKFLFTSAHSSRHLAAGALRFTKRVVTRLASSPKLTNQFYKLSSRNGLIVISRNLPARFIAHLSETIPAHVNYEMLQSSSPIDQVRSLESLESVLGARAQQAIDYSSMDRRNDDNNDQTSSSSAGSPLSGSESDEVTSSQPARMLSPTILMFITTDEAIDLVTRLRNDLAQVSRYYSLIVATREDISPALRTIFHRGGSRLCSGKAFYTISPKPDQVSEFSRYFRDTVQMEAESSDHPLVCEYAKYQSANKHLSSFDSDLDDISTEAVIKAVWAAAAAFKLVHKRECGSSATQLAQSEQQQTNMGTANLSRQQGRRQSQPTAATANTGTAGNGQTNGANTAANAPQKAAHNECMTKMNKNMSNLVQRTLKRLDVSINSTGLQALDGFRIKFDEFNELMTNKFTIRYINKECEITEIGHFSGLKDSALNIDDDLLVKSLESALPDPWPATTTTTTATATSTTARSETASVSLPGTTSSGSSGQTDIDSSTGAADGASASTSSSLPSSSLGTLSSSSDDQGTGSSTSGDDEPGAGSAELDARKSKRSEGARRFVPNSSAALSQWAGALAGLTDSASNEHNEQQRSTGRTNGSALPDTVSATMAMTRAPNINNMRKLRPYPNSSHAALSEWLPKGQLGRDELPSGTIITTTTQAPIQLNRNWSRPSMGGSSNVDLIATSTPLPESGGNTDLDEPPRRTWRLSTSSSRASSSTTGASAATTLPSERLRTAATETPPADYFTMPTTESRHAAATVLADLNAGVGQQRRRALSFGDMGAPFETPNSPLLADLITVGPVPLVPRRDHHLQQQQQQLYAERARLDPVGQIRNGTATQPTVEQKQQAERWKFRSHLKWISASWSAMMILSANVCGALLTLYVLILLLMKNCDGSLDRDNQSIRSIHLLAIIVVLFGSTLFIVYPTPGLCLLRSSWHNFSLVFIFGSLLLQSMQARCLNSIGLGGRPNRVNQFITLLFMLGVQIAFELQRWKYESANYVNFVQHYFSNNNNNNASQSVTTPDDNDRRFLMLNKALTVTNLNSLSWLNEYVTPVNLQLSEKYQNLLNEYCTQSIDSFIQSQIYLWLLIVLLILFSVANRYQARAKSFASSTHFLGSPRQRAKLEKKQQKKYQQQQIEHAHSTSGKLLASQHETNDFARQFDSEFVASQFSPAASCTLNNNKTIGNVLAVTTLCALIYFLSILLRVHGQAWITNQDLVSSVTMLLIALTTLVGIFMPVLCPNRPTIRQLPAASFDASSSSAEHLVTSVKIGSNNAMARRPDSADRSTSSSRKSAAFAMFPEFAPTGLRRPASLGGDSNSGLLVNGTHSRPAGFAHAKESRRNLGAALANMGPSAVDSLRSMGIYARGAAVEEQANRRRSTAARIDNTHPSNYSGEPLDGCNYNEDPSNNQPYHGHGAPPDKSAASQRALAASRCSGHAADKRLIMLDVDPCCPRHGVAAAAWANRASLTETGEQNN